MPSNSREPPSTLRSNDCRPQSFRKVAGKTHKCSPSRPGHTLPLSLSPPVLHRWYDGSPNYTTLALKHKQGCVANCAALQLTTPTRITHGTSPAGPTWSVLQSTSQRVAEDNCREALWFSQQIDRVKEEPYGSLIELVSRTTAQPLLRSPPRGWPNSTQGRGPSSQRST